MKVGIYALAKNESANVAAWESSCREADVRVVTDTGSTDDTVALLEAAGVTVARGVVVPWRWDDAHNLSLHHLPADVDVAIRLDLDEVLDPGWRQALEAAWTDATGRLRYTYHWSHDVRFLSDRIHRRRGYRWQGATHEGLVCWSGDEVQTYSADLVVRHHRQPGKRHSTDLSLLQQAVRENPLDARMHWYLARELDYAGDPGAAAAWRHYLTLAGGSPTERAYACRCLAKLEPDRLKKHLLAAILESPSEPEAFFSFAQLAWDMADAVSALYYARQATACLPAAQTHASDPRAYGPDPADLGCTAAWRIGLYEEALEFASEALRRAPGDERLQRNVEKLRTMVSQEGPRAA